MVLCTILLPGRMSIPRLVIDHLIDDLKIRIDDPELSYDHDSEKTIIPHDGSVYYLATWKDEYPIIGMVQVGPDFLDEDDEDGDDDEDELPRGLWIDYLITSKRSQRKGVATALVNAVESDARELLFNISSVSLDAYREKHSDDDIGGDDISSSGIEKQLSKQTQLLSENINIRLCCLIEDRKGLEFHNSKGYELEPKKFNPPKEGDDSNGLMDFEGNNDENSEIEKMWQDKMDFYQSEGYEVEFEKHKDENLKFEKLWDDKHNNNNKSRFQKLKTKVKWNWMCFKKAHDHSFNFVKEIKLN